MGVKDAMSLLNQISIRFADGPEDILQACRLRYSVLTKELGRRQYASDKDGTYRDKLDDGSSHIVLALCNGTTVGTLRFTSRRDAALLDEDELLFSTTIAEHELSECALADRGAIHPAYRKQGLYPKLWQYGFDHLKEQGIKWVFGVIDSDNIRLNEFHKGQGWLFLQYRVSDGGHSWNLIVKEL
jgi:GNAT superfamily N-acetyltransferase